MRPGVFTAPDGTEFASRAEYRKHLFLTQYTFKDRDRETLQKLGGEIDGQPFDLTSLNKCEIILLDHSEAVQVDDLTDCRVFIAACADSLFVRNCTDCVFTVACKQLRTRDCRGCKFWLYCKTEPIIETSTDMGFGPFNGAYNGHAEHLRAASLTTPNLWFGIYDFNDEAKTEKNWRLLGPEDEGEPWCPLDDGAFVAVPKTEPGSIVLPSKSAGGAGGGSGGPEGIAGTDGTKGGPTMAFSFETNAAKAAAALQRCGGGQARTSVKVATVLPTPAESARAAVGARRSGGGVAVCSGGEKTRFGWDPSRTGGSIARESRALATSTAAEGTAGITAANGGSRDGWALSRNDRRLQQQQRSRLPLPSRRRPAVRQPLSSSLRSSSTQQRAAAATTAASIVEVPLPLETVQDSKGGGGGGGMKNDYESGNDGDHVRVDIEGRSYSSSSSSSSSSRSSRSSSNSEPKARGHGPVSVTAAAAVISSVTSDLKERDRRARPHAGIGSVAWNPARIASSSRNDSAADADADAATGSTSTVPTSAATAASSAIEPSTPTRTPSPCRMQTIGWNPSRLAVLTGVTPSSSLSEQTLTNGIAPGAGGGSGSHSLGQTEVGALLRPSEDVERPRRTRPRDGDGDQEHLEEGLGLELEEQSRTSVESARILGSPSPPPAESESDDDDDDDDDDGDDDEEEKGEKDHGRSVAIASEGRGHRVGWNPNPIVVCGRQWLEEEHEERTGRGIAEARLQNHSTMDLSSVSYCSEPAVTAEEAAAAAAGAAARDIPTVGTCSYNLSVFSSLSPPDPTPADTQAITTNRLYLADLQRKLIGGAAPANGNGGGVSRSFTSGFTESTADSAGGCSNASSQQQPAPMISPLASNLAMAAAATAALERDSAPTRVGWNASRIGDPAVPAPTRNCVARKVAWSKETTAPSMAAATAAASERGMTGVGLRNARAGGSDGGRTTVGAAKVTGAGGGRHLGEVPLQLKAMLQYAYSDRGIDLRKWFNMAGEEEKEEEDNDDVQGSITTSLPLLTIVQFEIVLAGLAEGIKAGLSAEEQAVIDAAAAPHVVAAAASVAAAAAVSPPSGTSLDVPVRVQQQQHVDIDRLLDLCGINRQPRRGGGGERLGRGRGASVYFAEEQHQRQSCQQQQQQEQQRPRWQKRGGGVSDSSSSHDEYNGDDYESDDHHDDNDRGVDDYRDVDFHEDEEDGDDDDDDDDDDGDGDDDGDDDNDDDDGGDDHNMDGDSLYTRSVNSNRQRRCTACRPPGVGPDRHGTGLAMEQSERRGGAADDRGTARGGRGVRRRSLLGRQACFAGTGAAGSGSGGKGGRRGAQQGVEEDEALLRRVTGQADLYNRLLASLGLKQPVGSAPGSHAAWEARIRRSTVSLKALGKALGGVGLPLGKARVAAVAKLACNGKLIPPPPCRTQRRLLRRPAAVLPPAAAAAAAASTTTTTPRNRGNNNSGHRNNNNGDEDESNRKNIYRKVTTNGHLYPNKNNQANDIDISTIKGIDDGDRRRVSSWDLRTYLLKLRVEPKSREARDQRRRRFFAGGGGGGQGYSNTAAGAGAAEEGGWGDRAAEESFFYQHRPADFATWGRRVRGEKAERERERTREFQKALAGHSHLLSREELEGFVSRFEIMPCEMLSREVRNMAKAFSESVEGARRARELIRQWSMDSPASRNLCGPDDDCEKTWQAAQSLSMAQRRWTAKATVAREREEELAENEEADASVSRNILLAFMKTVGNENGRQRGGRAVAAMSAAGVGNGISLERWLEDKHIARKKARALEVGRERARALSKADTEGRQALVSEVKEELMRLVTSTKKPLKSTNNAPGMEVIRSSRDGLDIYRRLKLLEEAAEEAARDRRATAASVASAAAPVATATQCRRCNGGGVECPQEALLSKEVFNAEMGDILFSLTADGAAAARARELAGVPLIAPDLRKRWAQEGIPGREEGQRGDGGDDEDVDDDGGGDGEYRSLRSNRFSEELKVPYARELFSGEETLLRGRSRREADQKRKLVLKKYREWSKVKIRQARRAKKQAAAAQQEACKKQQQKKAEGLRAYRRWVRLAAKEQYFSPLQNMVVSRAPLEMTTAVTAGIHASSDEGAAMPAAHRRTERGGWMGAGSGGEMYHCGRQPWNASTEGVDFSYRGGRRGVRGEDYRLPEYL